MADTISLGFKLTGEADMKRGLADLSNALKLNASEATLTAAKYADNGKSAEALTAKNKVLQASIELEKQNLVALKAAIESASAAHSSAGANIERLKTELTTASAKMAEMKASTNTTKAELLAQQTVVKGLTKELSDTGKAYTSTGKSTTTWGTSLNKTETNIITMNKELDNNEKSLKRSETGSKSMADAVNGLASAAGINIPPALQGMITKLEGISAGAAALTVVVVGLVTGLGKLTMDTAKSADEIDVLSKVSGLTTDQIQELNYSAELLDVSTSDITGSMTKMIRSMESGKSATSSQAKAFAELKVKTTDSHGALLDSNEVFLKTIDALGKVKNETERDALAMTIFGKSARELNPLILAGSGRLKELAQAAHDTGNVMDKDTLKAFTNLDDAMKQIDQQFLAVKIQLAEALLPVMTKLAEVFNSIPTPVLTAIVVIGGIAAVIALIVVAIAPLIIGIEAVGVAAVTAGILSAAAFGGIAIAVIAAGALIVATVVAVKDNWGSITGFFQDLGRSIQEIFTVIAIAIATIVTAPVNAIKALIDGIIDGINNLKQSIGSINLGSIGGAIGTNFSIPSYATGTLNHPGGRALVGENGPEIVDLPSKTRVYPHGTSPSSSGDTYYVTIDAKNVKEFNDITRMAKQKGQRMVQGAS